jgi:PhnB protein
MTTLNPYLNFDGNCEEAFNFYKSVFSREFSSFQRFKEVPSENPLPPGEGDKVMHVALPIGSEAVLMGSDRSATMGKGISGNNVHLSLSTTSDEETTHLFNGLAAGGQITMPLQHTFWGATFGMLTDKFGIQWMVNQESNPPK